MKRAIFTSRTFFNVLIKDNLCVEIGIGGFVIVRCVLGVVHVYECDGD